MKRITLLVAALAAIILTGCGANKLPAALEDIAQSNLTYVSEFADVYASDGSRGKLGKTIYNDGIIYGVVYGGNEETYSESITVVKAEDFSAIGTIDVAGDFYKNKDGTRLISEEQEKDYFTFVYILGMSFDEDSLNVFIEWTARLNEGDEDSPDYEITKRYILRYDLSYKLAEIVNIPDDISTGGRYFSGMTSDADGNIYANAGKDIVIFDSDFNTLQDINVTTMWVDDFYTDAEGRMYISYCDQSWANHMVSVSPDSPKLGEDVPGLTEYTLNYAFSLTDKDFVYYWDSISFYSDNIASGKIEKQFDWLDINVDGNYAQVFAVIGDTIYGYSDNSAGVSQLFRAHAVQSSEMASKKEIRVASLTGNSVEFGSAVVEFNKSQDKYKVVVCDYYSWEKYGEDYNAAITDFNISLTGADAPDIVCLTDISAENLTRQGVLIDITPFIEKSGTINQEDYQEKVISAFTYDGKIVAIPRSFTISTLVVNTELLPDEGNKSWTLGDMIDFARSHPEAVLEPYLDRGSLLKEYGGAIAEEFIDSASRSCSFDSEEFKMLLEYMATLPEEYDWNNIDVSIGMGDQLANGKVLLFPCHFAEPVDIQLCNYYFGDKINYIGYPNKDAYKCTMLTSDSAYAITSSCKDKEGAWSFLEFYLSRDQGSYEYGFPSNKKELEKIYEEELKHSGQPNGDSLYELSGFTYDYHYCTKEELSQLDELIALSKVTDTDSELLKIISEEASGYFAGQKSVDEVAQIIQSRISLYINEKLG